MNNQLSGQSHLRSSEFPDVEHGSEQAGVRWAAGAVFFVIACWLGFAAITVQIEYFDGLSAIANARYFLGTTDRYVFDRGPLMALLLLPAELARTACGLHSMDVRPYHISLALLHVAYLILVYRVLGQVFGRSWFVFAAWAAAIPNYVFFSYGPFVSHDIIPGALLLLMLVSYDRYSGYRSYLTWTGLVALGAVAALVKQTFGIYWVLLLFASLFQCCLPNAKEARATFARLACGAVASGVITWLVLGIILENADPLSPLLVRPLRNLHYLANVYKGTNVTFPLWIYVRNCPAYGWLACLLVLPGWVLSMRGTRLQQSIAIAWLGALVFLHFLPLREVRYMAFLSPLTACLLVPAIRLVAQWRSVMIAAMLVLALDIGRCSLEAAQIFHPFYTSGIERRFFNLLEEPANRKRPILVNAPMLSFVSPIPSPFAADRYHRIFHFGIAHLERIYNCRDLRILTDEQRALRLASTCPEGSLLFYTDQVLARGPSWSAGAPVGHAGFTQCSAICRSKTVKLHEATGNGGAVSEAVAIVRPPAETTGPLLIQGAPCTASSLGELFPLLRDDSTGTSYWLSRVSRDSYAVSGLQAPKRIAGTQRFTIRQFDIVHLVKVGARN